MLYITNRADSFKVLQIVTPLKAGDASPSTCLKSTSRIKRRSQGLMSACLSISISSWPIVMDCHRHLISGLLYIIFTEKSNNLH